MRRLPRDRMRWNPGIRARVTLAASVVVALMLLGSGAALVLLLHQSLVRNLDDAATNRARTVAGMVTAGTLGTTVPNSGEESSLVQVVNQAGSVIAATGNVEGQAPILATPPRHSWSLTLDRLPVGTGPFRVIAEPVPLGSGSGFGSGSGWVYVATSLAQVDAAVGSLIVLFAVGLPLVLTVLAWVIWRTVGQVIRPVDAIRRQASVIGVDDLSQRVPVPRGNDEITSLAITVNEMLQRLETAAVRQGQFVADASHELRSPLAALRTQVDVALAHPEDPRPRFTLERVQEEVARMSTLIDDLLFLARSTERAPRHAAKQVDLDELLLAEAHRLRESAGVKVDLAGVQAARINGSERDLARMLRNLGDNAREHAASTVSLRLTADRGIARITVADDGPGIEPESRFRVFERFTRLDGARHRPAHGSGAGLGLAIAQQILLNHGGGISVADREDGRSGAVFIAQLPLTGLPNGEPSVAEQDRRSQARR
jgi:signal transduction histidine kinase